MGGVVEAAMAVLLLLLVCACMLATSDAAVLLSSLPNSFTVTVSTSSNTSVVEAGVDEVRVSWAWRGSGSAGSGAASSDADFRMVRAKLCYAPPSQADRGWRKTNDNLRKDKTCQFTVAEQAYTAAGNTTPWWRVRDNVPGAFYFVRAYALDASGRQLAYGQSSNSSSLLTVVPISGRPRSLIIATVCLSLFSIATLLAFFFFERRLMALKKAS